MFGLLVKTMEGREGVTRIWSSGSLRFYSWLSLNLNRPARAISALYQQATQGPLNFIQRTMYGGVSGHTSNVILETKPHHTLICLIYVHNTIDHWPIRPCIRIFQVMKMECQTVSGVLGCQGGQMSLGSGVGIATCQRFQPNINFFLFDNPETLKWLPL